ncbi:EscN/YscN/HrcN family type III secretion system ATPase [Citrobacter amalonaticus]|uniref:protein-secreting ATPase n=1 Tax=Citrobacter amalonaticus TaxID=35703 RepID=A0A2S4S2K7_CITAM|nr:type III secretion system ATPase SctN [Citrobacter amalonaticus]POT59505.1 EscN/YscN/HrcN family type III secretion system ATPase [Citrobacter amalonaticus]POT77635.1 EscN/YscN/HrcN family type III secretion system ATPase [Citrobacter amalonaticus]POU68087.1 EscN/YscN/HrcN family type III secretion system ATPase [Citrobacter amalonaticus]POV07691.1 EscN/YscN/HrcN family type III secretion system ATPase [Citrobacter amalonaticus]
MDDLTIHDFFTCNAKISTVTGSIITAPLKLSFVGERCYLYRSLQSRVPIGQAETIGLGHEGVTLSLLGSPGGISTSDIIVPTGTSFSVPLNDSLLGCVIDCEGNVRQRFGEQSEAAPAFSTQRPIVSFPPDFSERRPIREIFQTGIRVIDGLLTCGVGQRIGIFAGAGAGKTSLMSMIINHSVADVYIIGLVGERGREVTEFLAEGIPPEKRASTIVVYSTSDRPAVERRNAALIATTIAEYFRDNGKSVVLMVDSMTRYARALRDVALSAGEMPARRGYPASVFEELPRILERSGATHQGSITAFYTVLLEEEDDVDPIGDEIRSILDGHIYLSRKLSGKGHFPAIDVLRSASRVVSSICDPRLLRQAAKIREYVARLDELQLMLDLGEYTPGENPETDEVINKRPVIERFVKQAMSERSEFDEMLELLYAI